MHMELAYDRVVSSSCLRVYGEYLKQGSPVLAAIYAAGWRDQPFAAPEPTGVEITETMQTQTYCQPAGSGLFNSPTKEEWDRNISALRSEMKRLGINLGRPRKLTYMEMV